MVYQHKQLGVALLCLMTLPAIIIAIVGVVAQQPNIILPVCALIAVVAFLFSSLNISIDETSLYWSFGPGFWRKSISLSDIASARIVDAKWYYGLGIRLIPTGWLYIVSGTKAVEVTLTSGKRISLGSDETDALLAAIQQATSGN
ncbi:hypothetical protein [Thalassotalea agarivorans]|uniref:PH domain-containing protein n=1 Tax=Thalassotalea agarivorans TaxID=349064 RepID=A0A1I0EC31_THASX|nr:hypothetical protein [Thalassotalea agarivorans]SET42311.1 hypothetical protein SAMN05660429_01799 [Thalassotalea agarivorans]